MQKMEKRLSVAVILLLHTCWLYQRPLYLLLGDDENCSASTVLNSHNVTSQITSFQMKITNIVKSWVQKLSPGHLCCWAFCSWHRVGLASGFKMFIFSPKCSVKIQQVGMGGSPFQNNWSNAGSDVGSCIILSSTTSAMVCPKQSGRFVVCLLISKLVRWAVMPNTGFFFYHSFSGNKNLSCENKR